MSTAVLSDRSRQPAEPAALGGLAAQAAERRAKRDALQALGINPYPTRFERSATLADLHSAHSGLDPDTRTGQVASVAGRVASMRGHGKLRFATIEDAPGRDSARLPGRLWCGVHRSSPLNAHAPGGLLIEPAYNSSFTCSRIDVDSHRHVLCHKPTGRSSLQEPHPVDIGHGRVVS